MEPAPIFGELYWPILGILVAKLVHSLAVWLRPDWRWVRGVLAGATMVAGIVLLAVIYQAGHWAIIVPAGMPADQAAQLDHAVNLGLSTAFVPVGVVWLWKSAVSLWRLWRERGARVPA
jgi:hypothetical protein